MAASDDRLLGDLVLRSVPKLLLHLEAQERTLSGHVRRYLDRFAHCADPEQGFALLRCDCGAFKVLAFRCHARALCPSCGGRAMASGAAHLVDRVLPNVTVRQWVLSVPWPRRYLFARHAELCAGARRRVWRAVSRWYEHRAASLGHPGGRTGAVVVVQRFGSALNLNVHFHMLLLDGVFVDAADGDVRWVRVPAPTTSEVQVLVTHLARTLERWLAKKGYGADDACDEDDIDDDPNAGLFAASIAGRVALGTRAGAKLRRFRGAPERPFRLPALCAQAHGYNLHAAVVVRPGDRDALERLCRYVLRPPLAKTRIERRDDGLLVLSLRRPFADGTTQFVFSELELTEKLAALVPPARKNGISYHGVLAPRHRWRTVVVPKPPPDAEPRPPMTKAPRHRPSRWVPWAELLWRVFEVDGLACACGSRLVLHAVVQPPATFEVLESLQRSASSRAARAPPTAA